MSDADAPAVDPVPLKPRLVVHFDLPDPSPLPWTAGPDLTQAIADFLPDYAAFAAPFPELRWSPHFPGLDPELAEALVAKAKMAQAKLGKEYEDPRLLSYYRLVIRADVEVALLVLQPLKEALETFDEVDTVSIERAPPVVAATVTRYDEGPWARKQFHLDPSPGGVDSEFAWSITGGDGADVSLAVVEADWYRDHADLPRDRTTFLPSDPLPENLLGLGLGTDVLGPGGEKDRAHGTKTLGVVVGRDDGCGIVGMAPGAEAVALSTFWRHCPQGPDDDCIPYTPAPGAPLQFATHDLADAVTLAVDWLLPRPGSVLLLEVQQPLEDVATLKDLLTDDSIKLGPAEVSGAIFDAVEALSKTEQVVVVQAAGNRNVDLDTFAFPDDLLDPASMDSGAILVAGLAPDAGGEWARWQKDDLLGSNHGSRVDCAGPAAGVHSTSFNVSEKSIHDGDFGGTSSAAAVVAGVVMQLQGIAKACLGGPLDTTVLRDILRNSAYGVPKASATHDGVGWMPDLRKILMDAPEFAACDFTPDLYVRDHVGDVGDPHDGPVAMSPDILVRYGGRERAQEEWGEGSGTEDEIDLSVPLYSKRRRTLYVRMRNRGDRDAILPTARIFYSTPALLPTPDMWKPIGGVVVPRVPKGEDLTVSPGILWHGSQVPWTGHYCFIAVVGVSGDPEPDIGPFADFVAYVQWIKDQNNVTWRNFNVIFFPFFPFPFPLPWTELLMAGPFDLARDFEFFIPPLPREVQVEARLPLFLMDALGLSPTGMVHGGYGIVPLPRAADGSFPLGALRLDARARIPIKLRVRLPAHWDRSFDLALVQRYDGSEIGRVTWRYVARGFEPLPVDPGPF